MTNGGGKVLIVEDSQDVRNVMAEIVAGFGYDVSLAGDGLEAMNKLSTARFDLLITDIGMPNMGGEELVKNLRRSGNKIPVILIAGVDFNKVETDLKKLAACRFVKKPFDIDDFRTQIHELIRGRGKVRKPADKTQHGGSPSSRHSG